MDLSGNTFESNNLKKTQHKTFFKPDGSDRCIDISFLSDLPSIKMHMVLWSFIFFLSCFQRVGLLLTWDPYNIIFPWQPCPTTRMWFWSDYYYYFKASIITEYNWVLSEYWYDMKTPKLHFIYFFFICRVQLQYISLKELFLIHQQNVQIFLLRIYANLYNN